MTPDMTAFVMEVLVAVGIGVLGCGAAVLGGRLVHKLVARYLDPSWASFAATLVRFAIIFLTLREVVGRTGAAGALVVIITAVTGAMALGSERMAADLVAGLKLFLMRYYKVGQMTTIAGHHGMVESITLTYTAITTGNRDRIIIPNSEAVNKIVVNHSAVPGFRTEVRIPIPGPHDGDTVIEIMRMAAAQFDDRMPDDEPSVILADIGVNTLYYSVRLFVPEWAWGSGTESRVRRLVMDALEQAGIPVGIAPGIHAPTDTVATLRAAGGVR